MVVTRPLFGEREERPAADRLAPCHVDKACLGATRRTGSALHDIYFQERPGMVFLCSVQGLLGSSLGPASSVLSSSRKPAILHLPSKSSISSMRRAYLSALPSTAGA